MQNEAPETRAYAVLAHHLTKNGFEKMRDPERCIECCFFFDDVLI
jgi:hypothetical protein